MDRILQIIESGAFDASTVLTSDTLKFREVCKSTLNHPNMTYSFKFQLKTQIESISGKLSKETCARLLVTKIVPSLFNKNVEEVPRNQVMEIAFQLLKFANITDLPNDEVDSTFLQIEEQLVFLGTVFFCHF